MPAKRASRRRRPEASDSTAELSQDAVVSILESSSPSESRLVDADARRRLIAAEAYFIAQRRGFAAGHEFDDWLEAETRIDARLRDLRIA